ncbi:mfs-type transporter slc18b1 [Stylonychia lemnae]|uniref:Mfs-type transporter slc18b1 n=1 Tax=Stylonychia lemnae TaxID=5949 RepID=A0A078ACE8_STYLE|nr:mfs-type transporter slc18b1 [Stylonychia lemnae]|eukprot:CDW78498.1 mfs-type transporter slc18b1 [Stylonychia lemnae]
MILNNQVLGGIQTTENFQKKIDDYETGRNNDQVEMISLKLKIQEFNTSGQLNGIELEEDDYDANLTKRSTKVDKIIELQVSEEVEAELNNSVVIIEEQNDQSSEIKPKDQVNYLHLLMSPRGFFACLDILLCCQMYNFCDTSLPYYLDKEFGYSPSMISLVFVAQNIAFVITCFIAPKLTKKFNLILCIVLAQVIQGIAAQLIGPNETLHLPKYVWITILGLLINGGATSMTIIPPYKQLELALFEYKGKNFDKEAVKDTVSGAFNALYDLGSTTGPIFGYYVTAATNFQLTSNLQGYMLFLTALLQLLFFYIPEKLMERKRRDAQVNKENQGIDSEQKQ